MRYRVCSTWRQHNKPKAQPLNIEGRLRKNALSQPETKGRCQFIENHPLEVGKWCPSRSASSTIKRSMMLNMTSMNIATADMGMQRNTVTALTTVGVTTVTKTEWC